MIWRTLTVPTRRTLVALGLAVVGLTSACSALPKVDWPLVGDQPKVVYDVTPTPVSSRDWRKPPPGYLPRGGAPDALKILGPPPEMSSPTGKADQARFNQTRALAGSPRWVIAQRDADLSGKEAYASFSCAAGVRISPQTTPTLAQMMLRIESDAIPVYDPLKSLYNRPRPPVGNKKPICVPRERWLDVNGSYPSGHSLIGWTWGMILAELVPDRTSQLIARGRDFGESRVICGVHWQSDVQAGRELGSALTARLHADPGFISDLAKAREEIASARALGPPEGCAAS